MKILVTGAAGFIGSYVCKRLLSRGDEVVGLDNINSYYDVNLKYGRLGTLGIDKNTVDWYKFVQSNTSEQFRFVRINLEDKQAMRMLFANESFDKVVNLAAQAWSTLFNRKSICIRGKQYRWFLECIGRLPSLQSEAFGLR